MLQSNEMDAYIARFQNLPGFNIHSISADGQTTQPWFEVQSANLLPELVVSEATIPAQLQVITAEVQKWGRLVAMAKRVWEIAERRYRSWRSNFMLDAVALEGKPDNWKKPSEATLESMYRCKPEYHTYQAEVERSEEAYNATEAILQAWRLKKDALIALKPRYHEDGASPNYR